MKRVLALATALLLVPLLVRLLLAQSPAPPPSQAPPPPPTYTLTDLGSLNGASAIDQQNARTGATALNSNGLVAGYRLNLSFGDQPIGFLWNNGTLTDLGTGGGPQSWAYGINNAGQIVGTSNFPGDLSGQSSRAFLWQNGTMTKLSSAIPAIGATDANAPSRAYAINTSGTVAGFISNGGPTLPVIWNGGTPTLLQSLSCTFPVCQGEALAINDLGQATGWSVGGNVNGARPVMWDTNGQPTDLIANPGNYAQANGINSSGVVVGYYQPGQVSNTPIHAFSWQSGTLVDLGALGADTFSGAWGINTKGDIVGISGTTAGPVLFGPAEGGHAFLRTNGTMYDLTSLLSPGTNWTLDSAFAINDSGQIVGAGIAPDRTEHGYLLTPIITPTTTAATSSVNPSVFGQQVSFTATVTPAQSSALTPTGNVTFSDGATVLGTVALSSGTAILSTGTLAVGSHTITASYSGDNQFAASTSTPFTLTVSPAATTTTLSLSTNLSNYGQTVTLTAVVAVVAPGSGTPTGPTGTITFLDGSTTLGTAPVSSPTLFISWLAPGSHSISASYGGDPDFAGSASGASNVNVVLAAPAITSPPSGFTTNAPVIVAITAGPSASVTIFDGATTVVSSSLADGAGNFNATITLAIGAHLLTATQTFNGITSPASAPVSITIIPNPVTYTLTDLGPLNITAAPSGATALNASGQVAGFRFENFPSQVCFASGANRAFLWNSGAYTELGTLGGFSSAGYGINSAGQIVGSSGICPNGTETAERAFIWQLVGGNGVMTSLDTSTNSSDSSVAFAINANGDVAGYTNHIGNAANPQAVIWKGGTAAGLTALQSLACQFTACQTRALAINDLGQAAGWGLGPFVTGPLGSYNANQAVRWDANGQPIGLGSLGNYYNDQANAINSKGDVVGYSQIDGHTIHAVLWQSGNPQSPQDLGAIPGIDPIFGVGANITDNNSSAWGINTREDVVGVSGFGANVATQGNGGRAFLYTGGRMYDLLTLVPGSGWIRLEVAWAVNDNGQIVGVGFDANQQEHGFLLTPVITPTTTTLALSVNPSVFGQQVSFTATVSPSASSPNVPTGNVTFSEGANTLGIVALSSGTATFSTSSLTVGAHSVTASYGGDTNFSKSTSSAANQVVNQASTATTVAASPNPANVGQTVTLTATVKVVAPGAGTPSGTVTYSDGGTTLGTSALNPANTASFSTSSLAAGGHSITASYGGDANFSGSTSTSGVTVTVQGPPPPVQIMVNETVHVTDSAAFPDVFDAEAVKVADAVTVTPLIDVGAPVAEYSAGSLGFGNVAPGQSGTQSLTVSDTGKYPLTLSSASLSSGSAFSITQIACSNLATALPTTLQSGGACIFVISYFAPAGAAANDSITLNDNAALSNVMSTPTGSSYRQSIPLNGSGSSTAPPPPPPAVIPIMVNETVHVADSETFPDVFDAEAVHVADTVFVTPVINVGAPVAEYSAGSLGFGGQSGSQTITVSDIGQASLTLSSATISGSPQFAITQILCSNTATSLSTVLSSGGVCTFTIGYTSSATPANDSGALMFTDNAALSNITSAPAGSSYTQSIPLNGSGSNTPPPPPPPAVIPIMDNETVHVTDTESFPDVFDAEHVHVTDQVSVVPCDFTVSAASPVNLPVGGSGSTPITISSANGCNLQVNLSASTTKTGITISVPSTATTGGSSTTASLSVTAGPSVTPTSFALTLTGTAGLTHSASVTVNVTASTSGTVGVVQTLVNSGAIDNSGIGTALTNKLFAAQSAPNAQTSINTLKAFQNQVQAQAGKHIATFFTVGGVAFNPASTLVSDGQGLINALSVNTIPDPITGYVMYANGAGVAGAAVSIVDSKGSTIATATTDITGFYFMATTGVLAPGSSYTLRITTLPSGFATVTPPTQTFTWQGVAIAFSNFVVN